MKMICKGDTGRVYLVASKGIPDKANGSLFAMKVVSKQDVIKRNKVHVSFFI